MTKSPWAARTRHATGDLQRGAVHTTLGKVTDPDAILCRSNAGTMNEVMSLLEAGLTSR